ncbi:MAG TPA: glycosyltransferase [Tepidisphaeraceae bacterium]|jgi:glycosyltransferase involved in cell wall biosynthesis
MHILYVHQNFPAQFGHIARHLVQRNGWRCTFVSETPAGNVEGIEKVQYKIAGGATKTTHFCSRTFENAVWHTDGVYQVLKARPDIQPDLIVGHSGFGSTLFLSELYPDTPIVNFFEYYYRAHDPDSDMDFRQDLAWDVPEVKYLRSRCRNAMILLDLQNSDAAYTPTQFQKSRFPDEYLSKLQVIFDGVDRGTYHGYNEELRPAPGGGRGTRTIAGREVGPDTRVITYVSRGFESMRGFDVFMKAAKKIYTRYPDVLFFIVGTDRIAYGGDESYIAPHKSFKDWTLAQDQYDMGKFVFTGRLMPADLGRLLASSDLHMYLTVPFVLSWSMMDALSCGAVVLASATAPVKEMIQDGQNGLLADFFDTDEMADKAVKVLQDPAAYRPLGRAAEEIITRQYSLDAVLSPMLKLYEDAVNRRAAMPRVHRRKAAPSPQQVQHVPGEGAGNKIKGAGTAARTPFAG